MPFLIFAVVCATVGIGILLFANRDRQTFDSAIDEFSGNLEALDRARQDIVTNDTGRRNSRQRKRERSSGE
ncbi:MAG: hypothetical protein KDB86_08795 [Actinobacteria bacterium]|nr:hypothetical protein [Actinomycetota bacterium]MCB9390566.1 hypothetical protein [Acidimicrobiia bacterium]